MSEQIVIPNPHARHAADLEPYGPSRSGKNQWRCKVCGRLTQGAERECYTLDMWFRERQVANKSTDLAAWMRGYEE